MSTLKYDGLIGFSFDVEPGETKSQWQPAKAKKGLALFGDIRLLGFVSALQLGIAPRMILVGGDEPEHGINRAEAIKLMMIHDHGVSPERVSAQRSDPNTQGNLVVIRNILDEANAHDGSIAGMSNKYHLERMHQDRAVPPGLRLIPAESIWLMAAEDENEREQRRRVLLERFRHGLVEREVAEMNGIADIYAGHYRPH